MTGLPLIELWNSVGGEVPVLTCVLFTTVRVHDYTGFLLFRNLLVFLASGLFTFVLSVFCHLPLGGVHQQNSGGVRAC